MSVGVYRHVRHCASWPDAGFLAENAADMGVLLVFMFLANAFGALLLLPALAAFVLRKRGV